MWYVKQFLNSIQNSSSRAAHGRGHKCYSIQIPWYISHTDETCYGHNLARGDPKSVKTYKSRYVLLGFCWNRHFWLEISNFHYSGNKYRNCILIPNLQFPVLYRITTLPMWAKLADTVLDEVTVFLKVCDVIISVCDVTNKILSRDLIHLVDLVKLPTSHGYGISVREVHNFNCTRIWLEKRSFLGMVLAQNL